MLGILLGPEAKVCPTLNLPLYNVLIERADIDEALSMNAYFASFMLLLFNAVGLAVPASVAAEARMMPELGSTAIPSEASIADPSSVITSAKAALPDHHSADLPEAGASGTYSLARTDRKPPIWAVVSMRSEIGDKLEHEEGAP